MKETKDARDARLLKSTLTDTEFAIKNNAKFIVDTSTKINMAKDGTFTVTYKLANPTDDLQMGPGDIKADFDPCAVLTFSNVIIAKGSTISLFATEDIPQVTMKSKNLDVDLSSDGVKGEHGNSLRKSKNDSAYSKK